MKKILLIVSLILLAATIDKTKAQGQSIQIAAANDTGWTAYCSLPAEVNFYVYGDAFGYVAGDSIFAKLNFGDGTDTTVVTYAWPDSNGLYFSGYLTHHYTSTGTYSVQYIVFANNGNADTVINVNDVTISDSCGNVNGFAYSDNNSDCIFNAGDSVLRGALINLMGGGAIYYTWTDYNGAYWFDVPNGQYTLTVDSSTIQNGYSFSCPLSGSTSFTLSGAYSYNFGLTCNNVFDLKANMSGWGLRPGMHAYLNPQVTNLSCMPVSGTITLTLPALTTFDSAYYNQPFTVIGNTITWNYTNMYNGNYWWWYNNTSFWDCISILVDSSAQIGDTLCFTLSVAPTIGDANAANNVYTLCLPVRNSCDPNEKEVSPRGVGAANAVPQNTEFTYTVHFQNTGTDVAYNIFILDTLDIDLDLNTLEILATSHPMTIQMISSNILKFDYHNINLPDSGVNEALSHGYVTYKIKAKSNLTSGTQIRNTANIFFDFNAAVVTNTTLNTVDLTLNVNENSMNQIYLVYPNPTQDLINIEFGKSISGEVILTDMLGKEVIRKSVMGTETKMDVRKTDNGVYTLLVKEMNGMTSFQKIIINK